MGDGRYKRLGDVHLNDLVIAKTGLPCAVTGVHDQGALPLLRIRTNSGREILPALTHPFMTPRGWVEAQHLTLGTMLALLKKPQFNAVRDHKDEEFSLMGYFLGDGSIGYTNKHSEAIACSITNIDQNLINHFTACGQAMGFTVREAKFCETSPRARSFLFSDGSREWLREIGLAGCDSRTKRIPDFVFQSSESQIALLIGAFFDCDGYVIARTGRNSCDVAMTLAQREILEQLQHLLLRFSIATRIRHRPMQYKGMPYSAWMLVVADMDSEVRFKEAIPLLSHKAKRLEEWHLTRQRFDQEYLPDEIVEISPAGEGECRCLTVERDESFVANDFVVHTPTSVPRQRSRGSWDAILVRTSSSSRTPRRWRKTLAPISATR